MKPWVSWLGALAPRTLRARLIWLVLVVVLVTQALLLFAIGQYQRNQAQAVAVNLLVTSIRTLQATLGSIAAEQRAEFVQQASQGAWELIVRQPPGHARFQSENRSREPDDGDPELRRSLRHLAQEVNRELGRFSRVGVTAGEQPYLYVSIPPQGAVLHSDTKLGKHESGVKPPPLAWLKIPLDRVDPPLNATTILAWLLSLGALLLVAAGFSWHITRPLTELLRATEKLAAGQPERVEPAGPVETRRLGERFNAMLAALEQSERAQRTLLAGLPHDLKGPLARMALRIEMTDDPLLKAGLSRDLQDMQRLVEQFLAYVRGQDMSSLQLTPMRLDCWLHGRVTELQDLQTPLRLLQPLPEITVHADQEALSRLFDNLIENAMSYGQPPIEVLLRREGVCAVLEVSDHGPGIAPEDRARALEPFVRLDPARTKTGSAGLGLSVVQTIANAHGGGVELGRAEQGGLRVRVYWPLLS